MDISAVEPIFQRLGSPQGSGTAREYVIPAQHTAVTVSFSGWVARFFLRARVSDAQTTAAPYRETADLRPVVAVPRPLNLVFRRQTAEDAAHVASGVARKVRSGNTEFDQEVYIETTLDESRFAAVLDERTREAIHRLIRSDRASLRLERLVVDDDRGCVVAQWAFRNEADLNVEVAQRMVADVDAIVAALPALVASERRSQTLIQPLRIALVGQYLCMGGVNVALYAVGTAGRDCPLVTSLVIGGLVSAVLMAFCYFFIRGQTDSPELRSRVMAVCLWMPLELSVIIARLVS